MWFGTAPLSAATPGALAGVKGQQTPTTCAICNFEAVNIKKLKTHILLKHPKVNLCLVCVEKIGWSDTFASESSYHRHYTENHRRIIKKKENIKCQYCPAKFLTLRDMDNHKTVHEKMKCQFCPSKFMTNKEIKAHLSSVHAKKCYFCPLTFYTIKDMEQHKKLHEKIKCHLCPEKFAPGVDMNAHLRSVHAIKCQFCPAKFMTNKEMKAHLSSAHRIKCQAWDSL